MRLAIRKHFRAFLAVIGLVVLGVAMAVYILGQQSLRFPLVEDTPKQIQVELENAQAVQPGQGQTVRVAGVEVGRIAGVEVEDGVAVVELEIDSEYEDLIREDATALLRPKTALKDMFIEVDARHRPRGRGGRAHPGRQHAAGRRPGRDLRRARRRHAALPEAARGGRGQGAAPAAAPTCARCSGASSRSTATSPGSRAPRPAGGWRSSGWSTDYGLLMTELGRRPERPAPPRERVAAACSTRSPASSRTSRPRWPGCPGALRATERALERGARLRAAAAHHARVAARADPQARPRRTRRSRRSCEETTPVLRDEIRPFVRAARPVHRRPAPGGAATSARPRPTSTTSLEEVNRFFNIGAYNPGGAEGLGGLSVAAAARPPGGLPLLARLDRAERRVALLDRRRPGPVAAGDDLRRPRRRADRPDRRRAHRASAPPTRASWRT